MSMLDRYRKPGGFKMLIQVVETSGLAKQEKFLELIRAEDSVWADALKSRLISISRFYAWNDEAVSEILGAMPDLTLATCLQSAPPEFNTRVETLLTNARRRKITDLMKERTPIPAEISTTHAKILSLIRQMVTDGQLRFEKFDPSLQIEDNIEEMLGRHPTPAGSYITPSQTAAPASGAAVPISHPDYAIQYDEPPPAHDPLATPAEANHAGELLALKRKLAEVVKENTAMRAELATLKNKLLQIKKIA